MEKHNFDLIKNTFTFRNVLQWNVILHHVYYADDVQ